MALPTGTIVYTAIYCAVLMLASLIRWRLHSKSILAYVPKLHGFMFALACVVDTGYASMMVLRSLGLSFSHEDGTTSSSFPSTMLHISRQHVLNGDLRYQVWYAFVPATVLLSLTTHIIHRREEAVRCRAFVAVIEALYYLVGRVLILPIIDTLLLSVVCTTSHHQFALYPNFPACGSSGHALNSAVSMVLLAIYSNLSFSYSMQDRSGLIPIQLMALLHAWCGALLGGWNAPSPPAQQMAYILVLGGGLLLLVLTRVWNVASSVPRVWEMYGLCSAFAPLLAFAIQLGRKDLRSDTGHVVWISAEIAIFCAFVWLFILTGICMRRKLVKQQYFGIADVPVLSKINPCDLHFGSTGTANMGRTVHTPRLVLPPIANFHHIGNPFLPATAAAELRAVQEGIFKAPVAEAQGSVSLFTKVARALGFGKAGADCSDAPFAMYTLNRNFVNELEPEPRSPLSGAITATKVEALTNRRSSAFDKPREPRATPPREVTPQPHTFEITKPATNLQATKDEKVTTIVQDTMTVLERLRNNCRQLQNESNDKTEEVESGRSTPDSKADANQVLLTPGEHDSSSEAEQDPNPFHKLLHKLLQKTPRDLSSTSDSSSVSDANEITPESTSLVSVKGGFATAATRHVQFQDV